MLNSSHTYTNHSILTYNFWFNIFSILSWSSSTFSTQSTYQFYFFDSFCNLSYIPFPHLEDDDVAMHISHCFLVFEVETLYLFVMFATSDLWNYCNFQGVCIFRPVQDIQIYSSLSVCYRSKECKMLYIVMKQDMTKKGFLLTFYLHQKRIVDDSHLYYSVQSWYQNLFGRIHFCTSYTISFH